MRSEQFDLGLDTTRMKDPRDAERQTATVDALLTRMFGEDPEHRMELQVLADEVGMGKTFVALAVAYSVLAHVRTHRERGDLSGCYQRVLIITPLNSALYAKWQREVSEFTKRCVLPSFRADARKWFAPEPIDRLEDIGTSLKRRGPGPRVMVTSMGLFTGGKLVNYDLKRRFTLRLLFRYWGKRFRNDRRRRLLKGASDKWSKNPDNLLTDINWDELPFNSEKHFLKLLRRFERRDGDETAEKLLDLCLEISERYVRNRDDKFQKVEHLLVKIYRRTCEQLIRKAFPLIVVDEAHNWKNGPKLGSNGFEGFARMIAPNTRRALLLTATPFQLRPEEMLEILKVTDYIMPCPQQEQALVRRERLEYRREQVIRPVLSNSARASRRFAKAWAKLPPSTNRNQVESIWHGTQFKEARDQLRGIAELEGVLSETRLKVITDTALKGVDPALSGLFREALALYAYNADLSQELSTFVIRHRRHTEHRLYRVGREYEADVDTIMNRQDSHLLHAVAGLDVRGPGELPHYILMRCVTEMKQGKGRSSLGTALTGCYSTLLESAEGKQVKDRLEQSPRGRVYLDLLMDLVNTNQDKHHPKIQAVVEEVMKAWRHGEKSLVFCFRVNTARRLRDIIDERIRSALEKRQERCMGGAQALRVLRGRLTGRDRDLIPIGLDRVFWSWNWAIGDGGGTPVMTQDLLLTEDELRGLAELALRFDIDMTGDRIDRVFLHRATEYLLARRFRSERRLSTAWLRFMVPICELDWVRLPYGQDSGGDGEEEGEERASFDERGVHSRYEETAAPSASEVEELAQSIKGRREQARLRNQASVFDVYGKGPNLWLGVEPHNPPTTLRAPLQQFHRYINGLSTTAGAVEWMSRLQVFQALRRALLRESVLLRLLPDKTDREEAGWGELLVQAFLAPMPYQQESMADRIAVFLEDLQAASGGIGDGISQRGVLFESTRLRDQQFVALVDGSTKKEVKERIFAGFNTPLLPEVLICTSVGQEGIDLHRHCRHVVHYDLAWNPAVLEQRTGRADRIGSKTFRERARTYGNSLPFLEVGVPFLAGTYDERMYEELRLRTQTFEVLTGGDLAADNAEGDEASAESNGEKPELSFAVLPQQMIQELRVHLEAWREG